MYNSKREGLIVPTDKPRFCITVDDALMKEIDDFRFGAKCYYSMAVWFMRASLSGVVSQAPVGDMS